jgi:hypothetical protein
VTNWIAKGHADAAARVEAVLAKPLAEHGQMSVDDFDPWEIMQLLYGCYDSDFDECAIHVLEELRDGTKRRDDLGAEMLREMLCNLDLCEYGSSPRVCFPTEPFRRVLPSLIEKWKAYAQIKWGNSESAGETL